MTASQVCMFCWNKLKVENHVCFLSTSIEIFQDVFLFFLFGFVFTLFPLLVMHIYRKEPLSFVCFLFSDLFTVFILLTYLLTPCMWYICVSIECNVRKIFSLKGGCCSIKSQMRPIALLGRCSIRTYK